MMRNKQILVITDEDESFIPIATLILSEDADLEQINRDIRKVKNDLPGEWQMSDIIEGISVDFEELSFECISL